MKTWSTNLILACLLGSQAFGAHRSEVGPLRILLAGDLAWGESYQDAHE